MADDEVRIRSSKMISTLRMEEASKVKKLKKGFWTPKRKQKLRLLLRKKAYEEQKKEQERKAVERKHTIKERCGKATDLRSANEETLKSICNQYHSKIATLENDKYDLEYIVATNDMELDLLNINFDLRRKDCPDCPTGRFFRPILKKAPKHENKFAQTECRTSSFKFGNQLKVVKKLEFTLADKKEKNKSDWYDEQK